MTSTCDPSTAGALPIIRWQGRSYWIDLHRQRLDPLVGGPGIDMTSETGRQACATLGLITCRSCRYPRLIPKAHRHRAHRCPNCGVCHASAASSVR